MQALAALQGQALLSNEQYDTLTQAYIFLRDVENKLQMVNDAQTHSLPRAPEELATCARLLGYADDADGTATDHFLHEYQEHTGRVNRIFDRFLGSGSTAFT